MAQSPLSATVIPEGGSAAGCAAPAGPLAALPTSGRGASRPAAASATAIVHAMAVVTRVERPIRIDPPHKLDVLLRHPSGEYHAVGGGSPPPFRDHAYRWLPHCSRPGPNAARPSRDCHRGLATCAKLALFIIGSAVTGAGCGTIFKEAVGTRHAHLPA